MPFGPDNGDALVPIVDDGSGPPLFISPFPYLGTNETVIFVSKFIDQHTILLLSVERKHDADT